MNPGKVALVDGLVHGEVERGEQVVEPAIVGRVASGDVGSLSFHVLAGRRASHFFVEARAAIAAIHMYRLSPRFAQRVEDVVNELLKAFDGFGWRSVVDAAQRCGGGTSEFFKCEMFHGFFRRKVIHAPSQQSIPKRQDKK